MEEQPVRDIINATHLPRMMAASALGMLALFLLVLTASELKSYRFIGSGVTATNTITVSGEGDVFAVPNIGTFSVTEQQNAKDVQTAQETATTKMNAIIDYLKQQGIEEKDIQTTDYSVNPHYEWQQASCPASTGEKVVYCPPGKQVLNGYDVSQTITVKVHDTKKAGDLLSGVGSKGATNVSGLSFTVENPDDLQAQARDKAITQAKTKADALAKSLGVSIVRVVGFSEGSDNGYERKTMSYNMASGAAMDAAVPAPQIPIGQNKITSNVSVTYEIR